MEEKAEIDKILAMILILLLPLIIEQSCQYLPDNLICIIEKPFIEYSELPKSDTFQTANLSAQVSTVTTSGASVYTSSTTTL